MVILLSILFNLLILWVYYRIPKKLHPIESACLFMIGFLYGHDWLIIATHNLNDWKITEKFSYDIALFLNRTFMYPLLLLVFMEKFYSVHRIVKRINIFVLWVSFMLLFEYFHDWIGFVQHKQWKFSWSIILWTILGLLLIGSRVILNHLLRKVN